jgi:hypothetical protein
MVRTTSPLQHLAHMQRRLGPAAAPLLVGWQNASCQSEHQALLLGPHPFSCRQCPTNTTYTSDTGPTSCAAAGACSAEAAISTTESLEQVSEGQRAAGHCLRNPSLTQHAFLQVRCLLRVVSRCAAAEAASAVAKATLQLLTRPRCSC